MGCKILVESDGFGGFSDTCSDAAPCWVAVHTVSIVRASIVDSVSSGPHIGRTFVSGFWFLCVRCTPFIIVRLSEYYI